MRQRGKEFWMKNGIFTLHLIQRRMREDQLIMTNEHPVLLVMLSLLVRILLNVMDALIGVMQFPLMATSRADVSGGSEQTTPTLGPCDILATCQTCRFTPLFCFRFLSYISTRVLATCCSAFTWYIH